MAITLSENFRAVFYAPFYAIQALGFYAREGVEVALLTSPAPAAAQADLLAGRIDITWGGPMRVMKARDQDSSSPLVCFGEVVARDPFFLIGRADGPDFRLADLPRLRFATVSEVPTPWLCLQHDLRQSGIDPDRLERTTDRTMADNLEGLRRGDLDVAQLFEPYVSMALRDGSGKILYAASTRRPTVYTTFLATRAGIARNRTAFAAMLRAVRHMQAWLSITAGKNWPRWSCRSIRMWRSDLLAASLRRYHDAGLWARHPEVSREGFARLAESLRSGGFVSRVHAYEGTAWSKVWTEPGCDHRTLTGADKVLENYLRRRLHPHNQLLPKLAQRCGQRRQLRVVARVEDATDFLLVLSDAAPQFGLGESRALEGLQDRDLCRDLRLDGNRNQAPSLCLGDRHRQSPPGIGQQRQAERLLCLLDRVSFAVALRYRLRDVREAYDHAGFVARFEPRGINERSHVSLSKYTLLRPSIPLIEAGCLPDLAGGLRVDLPCWDRCDLVGANPNHQMPTFATMLLHPECQISILGLAPKFGNEFCSLIHIQKYPLISDNNRNCIDDLIRNVNRFRAKMSENRAPGVRLHAGPCKRSLVALFWGCEADGVRRMVLRRAKPSHHVRV